MQLLTVTCWRDFDQFSLQIASISKFLKGNFKHFIIINDLPKYKTKKYLKKWYSIIENYYTDQIPYEIIFPNLPESQLNEMNGWQTQQIYKFYYYEHINDDYIILDSKNFFIRECLIDRYKLMIGSGEVRQIHSSGFEDINNLYANYFETKPLNFVLHWITPFVVEYQVLKNFGSPEKIADNLIFIRPDNIDRYSKTWPSEFIWYSYLIKDKIFHSFKYVNSYIMWGLEDVNESDFYQTINKDKSIKVTGIHLRAFLNLKNLDNTLKNLNNFLEKFELPKFS